MNLNIRTNDDGSIKNYCIDFYPRECSIAIEFLTNLTTPVVKQKQIKTADNNAPKVTKSYNKQGYNISEDTFNALKTYFRPSARAAFMKSDISYGTYKNINAYKRITKQILEKLASIFNIKYIVENDNLLITPYDETDSVPKQTSETVSENEPDKAYDNDTRQGWFVRYQLGSFILKKWKYNADEQIMNEALKAIYQKKCENAGYKVTFKVLESRQMTFGDYKKVK